MNQLIQTDGPMSGYIAGRDQNVYQSASATPAVQTGFQSEVAKTTCLHDLDALRAALRELRKALNTVEDSDEERLEHLMRDILRQMDDFNRVKETVEAIPVGQAASSKQSRQIQEYLDNTETLLDTLKQPGNTPDGAEKIASVAQHSLSLLANIRQGVGI